MPVKCITCGRADLTPSLVRLAGKVRGESYTVEMMGLACPNCDYRTIKGPDMPEFGRLLADQWRSQHRFLTSVEIRQRRTDLRMSQQEFANFLGVGVASVKRWELGKIQDKLHDDLIRQKTAPKDDLILAVNSYVFAGCTEIHGNTSNCIATSIGIGGTTFANIYASGQTPDLRMNEWRIERCNTAEQIDVNSIALGVGTIPALLAQHILRGRYARY